MNFREDRLRRQYVTGAIEIDEFERRLDALLHGRPEPEDARLPMTDEPGAVFYYNPAAGTPAWMQVVKEAWTRPRLQLANPSQTNPQEADS